MDPLSSARTEYLENNKRRLLTLAAVALLQQVWLHSSYCVADHKLCSTATASAVAEVGNAAFGADGALIILQIVASVT